MKKYHMKMDMMQAVTDTLAKECAGDYFITGDRKLLMNKWLLSNGCEFASCEIFFSKLKRSIKSCFTAVREHIFIKAYQQSLKTKETLEKTTMAEFMIPEIQSSLWICENAEDRKSNISRINKVKKIMCNKTYNYKNFS